MRLEPNIHNHQWFPRIAASAYVAIAAAVAALSQSFSPTIETFLPAALRDSRAISRFIPDMQQIFPSIMAAVDSYLHSLWAMPAQLEGRGFQVHGWAPPSTPKKLTMSEIALAAVKKDGTALQFVPEESITLEIALAAVKQNGRALQFVPKELVTPEIFRIAVKQNGWALQYVPKEFITPEIALAIVKQDGETLRHVPKEFITPEIALAVVEQDGETLRHVPTELITAEIALAAVKKDGTALRCVPKELITAKIALAAVKTDGTALQFVPKELVTPEIIHAAVQENGRALQFVPKELITPEILLAAVQQNGVALQFVPKELITPEIALAAVQQNVAALLSVPKDLITDDVIETVFGRSQAVGPLTEQPRPHVLAKPQDIAPSTASLPYHLQRFVDQYLFVDQDLDCSSALKNRGFKLLASGSLKDTWTHPELPGYVFKTSHTHFYSKEPAAYALIQDALTMRHLQTIVDQHNLSKIVIPETYLITNGHQAVTIQQKIQLTPSTSAHTTSLLQLKTLIQLMDQTFYPLVSNQVKAWRKDHVMQIGMLLVERATTQPLPPAAQQFVERTWVWDLNPALAHNAGIVKGTDHLAIIDGAI